MLEPLRLVRFVPSGEKGKSKAEELPGATLMSGDFTYVSVIAKRAPRPI